MLVSWHLVLFYSGSSDYILKTSSKIPCNIYIDFIIIHWNLVHLGDLKFTYENMHNTFAGTWETCFSKIENKFQRDDENSWKTLQSGVGSCGFSN